LDNHDIFREEMTIFEVSMNQSNSQYIVTEHFEVLDMDRPLSKDTYESYKGKAYSSCGSFVYYIDPIFAVRIYPNYTVPTDLVGSSGDTLSDVELPKEVVNFTGTNTPIGVWSWKEPTTELEVGEHTYTALFTPESELDLDNPEQSEYFTYTKKIGQYEVEVTVTVEPPAEDEPDDGEEVTTDGEAVTTDGEAVTTDGEAVTTDGEAVTTDGEVVTIDGETVTTDDENGSVTIGESNGAAVDEEEESSDKEESDGEGVIDDLENDVEKETEQGTVNETDKENVVNENGIAPGDADVEEAESLEQDINSSQENLTDVSPETGENLNYLELMLWFMMSGSAVLFLANSKRTYLGNE